MMRRKYRFKATALTLVAILACAPVFTNPLSANAANSQGIPPAVQQMINQAFQTVSGIVIKNAEKINQWTTVQVLNGFNQANCSQPLQVCKTINTQANITFDLGTDPITNLKNAMQGIASSCTQQVTVGCLNPPFGITPTYASVLISDPTKAKITWTGKPGVKAGYVTVDLSKVQWSAFCTPKPVKIPGPPSIKVGKQVINFPFLCGQLKYANLVANQ